MRNDRLQLTEIKGSPEACGEAYGEAFAPLIMGFCKLGLDPNARRLAYARKCWPYVEQSAPVSAEFMRGMARGSGLPLELITLTTLHEEIVHQPHCTALVVTGSATRDGKSIAGQNWDWAPHLYPWPGLLRMRMSGSPRLVTYHYPGLWACAGINEAGLSLVWTGGGYIPKVSPVIGLPTYVLIAEILRLRSVDEALSWLAGVKHAGSFIFFLADATGATAVVEAVPRRVQVDQSGDAMSRANHYLCPDVVHCARQVTPSRSKYTTSQRAERMQRFVDEHYGRFTPAVVKAILTDRSGDWPWLHQMPGGKRSLALEGMTIDSFFAIPQDRVFWTCRGGPHPGPWQSVSP